MKICLVAFWEKNLFWGNLVFSSHFLIFDWVWSKLSQDMISQVNVYVADSVLRYNVMFMHGGQYST